MTNISENLKANWPDAAFWGGFAVRILIGVAVVFGVIGVWMMSLPNDLGRRILDSWLSVRVSTPVFNPVPLLHAPLSVQVHVLFAVLAVGLGAVILLLPKGTGLHRLMGWSWVVCMIMIAATSVAMIADLSNGINALHVFTAITVISLWGGLAGIWRGNVRQHASSMTGLYVGGLFIAGLFAFLPGRLMWMTFFGG